MAKILVYCLLFVLPFLVLPFGTSQFETPKVIAAEVLIEILVFYTVAFGKSKIRLTRISLASIVILFLLTIIDLVFLRTNTTFFGNPFRLQGVFLLWHLLALAIVSSQTTFQKLSKKFLIVPLVLLLITVPLFGTNLAGRVVGSLGEPNFLAAIALFFWPFFLSLREGERPKKILLLIGIVITGVILFLTKSHSAMIGLGVQLLFLFLTVFAKFKMKWSLIVCTVLLGASLILPFITARDPYEDRATIWQLAAAATVKNPIIGYGFGNGEKILKTETIENKTRLTGYYVDSAHNFLLDYSLSGGIFGLVVIIALVGLSFGKFTLEKNLRNITLLLGVLATMLFNPSSVVTLLAFWWLLGQGTKI